MNDNKPTFNRESLLLKHQLGPEIASALAQYCSNSWQSEATKIIMNKLKDMPADAVEAESLRNDLAICNDPSYASAFSSFNAELPDDTIQTFGERISKFKDNEISKPLYPDAFAKPLWVILKHMTKFDDYIQGGDGLNHASLPGVSDKNVINSAASIHQLFPNAHPVTVDSFIHAFEPYGLNAPMLEPHLSEFSSVKGAFNVEDYLTNFKKDNPSDYQKLVDYNNSVDELDNNRSQDDDLDTTFSGASVNSHSPDQAQSSQGTKQKPPFKANSKEQNELEKKREQLEKNMRNNYMAAPPPKIVIDPIATPVNLIKKVFASIATRHDLSSSAEHVLAAVGDLHYNVSNDPNMSTSEFLDHTKGLDNETLESMATLCAGNGQHKRAKRLHGFLTGIKNKAIEKANDPRTTEDEQKRLHKLIESLEKIIKKISELIMSRGLKHQPAQDGPQP